MTWKSVSLSAAAAVALLASPLASAAEYKIDTAHSGISFGVRHLMVSTVRGSFGKFSGTVTYDPADIAASSVEVTIDAASIDTGNSKRDDHLRSADFFETETYPTLTFKSTKVEGTPGALKVTGDLTMHGVTKSVVLDVDGPTDAIKSPWGQNVRGASATTAISRKEFGLTWNKMLEAGGVSVGDEVKIQIDMELIEVPPPAVAEAAEGDATPAAKAEVAAPAKTAGGD